MRYTVKQLADLAGVTPRTLHHYDQIGLLRPAAHGENGYRHYGAGEVLRLQQVLFYKELGLSLDEIRSILDRPGFDVVGALQAHRVALQRRAQRLRRLIGTVDRTIQQLKGQRTMNANELFAGFNEETQKRYAQEARELYGEARVADSERQWASYSPEKKKAIQAGMGSIFTEMAGRLSDGPASPDVQALVARLHEHLGYFFDRSLENLRGVGHGYNSHPDFITFFQKLHPDLPPFLEQAITLYCDSQQQ